MKERLFKKGFDNFENLFFYCILLTGLIPLISQKYFLTLDGPAHLYNSVLIKSLFTGNYPEINQIFQFNTFPVPNWTGHFLFALFGMVLPGFLTEKVVLFFYLFFTPFIFRKLVLLLAPENKAFSYLMILFVHNYTFYLGFFNLSFGILFMFLTLYYFYKNREEISYRQIPILSGLLLLTYFSHLFPLMILLFILILLQGGLIRVKRTDNGILVSNVKAALTSLLKILIAALPVFILTVLYLIKIDSVQDALRPKIKELLSWLIFIKPLLTLKVGFPWKIYTFLLFLLFLVMIATFVTGWMKNSFIINKQRFLFKGKFRFTSIFWFTISGGFLLLFLLFPNANLLSERLILFFYLFLILGLAFLFYPKWLHYTALVVILTIHLAFTVKAIKILGNLSTDVELLKKTTEYVEPGSLLLTINNSDNWRYMHISGYIGSDRPIVVLENYEAGLEYFPLKWNPDISQPNEMNEWNTKEDKTLSQLFINGEMPTAFSVKTIKNGNKIIPYVLVMGPLDGHPEKINADAIEVLSRFYEVQETNSFCTLYILKEENP